MTYNGLLQHTLQKLDSGLSFCVVCLVMFAINACCLKHNRCPRTEGFSPPCSLQSKKSPLAAPIEKFLVVVIWLVLGCVGAQDVGKSLSWACHGYPACQLLQTVVPAPVSSSLLESLIRDFQFDRCSLLLDLPSKSSAPVRLRKTRWRVIVSSICRSGVADFREATSIFTDASM